MTAAAITVVTVVVIVILFRFGVEYTLTRPSESGAWFWRKTRRDMLRWVFGGTAAVLPPAVLNFYLILNIDSWLVMPVAVAAGIIHMRFTDAGYPLSVMDDREKCKLFIKYTAFHMISAAVVWWLFI